MEFYKVSVKNEKTGRNIIRTFEASSPAKAVAKAIGKVEKETPESDRADSYSIKVTLITCPDGHPGF